MDSIDLYKPLLDTIRDKAAESAPSTKTGGGGVMKKRKESTEERQHSMHRFFERAQSKKTKDNDGVAVPIKTKATKAGGGVGEFRPMHLFPDPNNPADPVILISTEFWVYGDKKPFLKTVHGLRTAMERPEMDDVVKFRWSAVDKTAQHAMLSHWTHMLCSQMDLEWLVTWNGIGYDLPFLFVRAMLLDCRRFIRMGKFLAWPDEAEPKATERRYKQCLLKPQPKIGKPLRRGNGVDYDFPGIKVLVPGVLQLDVMVIIKGMKKMETYALKEVAKKLLKNQKKRELKAVLITPSWCTDDFYRSVVEYYGMEDSQTTGDLAFKQMIVPHITELMALTRTSANDLAFRGQQKKTWNQFVYSAHHRNWLLDEPARQEMQKVYGVKTDKPSYLKTPEERQADHQAKMNMTRAERSAARIKYTGGFVLEPEPDYYTDEICTEDFNSLYPTTMIAHNLCWSTWLKHRYTADGKIWFELYGDSYETQDHSRYMIWRLNDLRPTEAEAKGRDIILVVEDWGSVEAARWIAYQQWCKLRALQPARPPHHPDPLPAELPPEPRWEPAPGQLPNTTCCFVVNRDSILPPILRKLLDGRAAVKKLQKAAKAAGDTFMEGVYEARQLALKLSANASYGFTGAVDGFFGGVAIGAATCLLGRHYILLTNITARREFWGPSVYGDTDSVFVRFPFLVERYRADAKARLKAVEEQGEALAKLITLRCPNPMKIELEKIIIRLAMYRKKMYGYKTSKAEPGEIDTKGLSSVRRDYALLVREAHTNTLKLLLELDPAIIRAAQATFLEETQEGTAAYMAAAQSKKRKMRARAGASKKKKLNGSTQKTLDNREASRTEEEIEIAQLQASTRRKMEKLRATLKDVTKEQTRAACDQLLQPLRHAIELIATNKVDYEQMQRTAAKGEKYANENLMQVQAIKRAEERRQAAFDVGHRVPFVVVRPKVLPKVKNAMGQLEYDMSHMAANAEETSYAEENQLPLHRMYYVKQLVTKIEQALSLVLSQQTILNFIQPWMSRIYREDFKLQDMTSFYSPVPSQKSVESKSADLDDAQALEFFNQQQEEEEEEQDSEEESATTATVPAAGVSKR